MLLSFPIDANVPCKMSSFIVKPSKCYMKFHHKESKIDLWCSLSQVYEKDFNSRQGYLNEVQRVVELFENIQSAYLNRIQMRDILLLSKGDFQNYLNLIKEKLVSQKYWQVPVYIKTLPYKGKVTIPRYANFIRNGSQEKLFYTNYELKNLKQWG